MQGGGIYGVPLPFAKNSATSFVVTTLIHGAGGQIFTPDLQVAIDSDATANALEFYKSLRELAPPGATSYSWGELITAFVSGATATGYYAGRVLVNVSKQNPEHRRPDHLCPVSDDLGERAEERRSTTSPACSFRRARRTWRLPRNSRPSCSSRTGYIKQLLAAPGHVLPVLKHDRSRTRPTRPTRSSRSIRRKST